MCSKILVKICIFGLATALELGLPLPAAAAEQQQDLRPIVEIDVRNFVNKTDSPKANFQAFADRVAHEFVETGVYRVINADDVADIMKRNEKWEVISDEDGKKYSLPIPAFSVKMSIVRYGFSTASRNDNLSMSRQSQELATIEIILQIVDMRTGEIRISKNLPPMSARVNIRTGSGQQMNGNFREQALQEACRRAAKATVREVVLCTPFHVVDVEDDEIEADIPRSIARPGDVFTVLRLGKPRVIPRTGKTEFKKRPIGKMVLTSCDEDTSIGRPVTKFSAPVSTNCIVMMERPEEKAKSVPPPSRPWSRQDKTRPF